MPRVAIYARVSTKDKGQSTDNQLDPLRAFAADQKWEVVREYIEHESASGKARRSQFAAMMHDADSGQFDLLLFWSLDRFSREGVTTTLYHLQRLTAANVGWKSLQEKFLDTTTLGPFREVVIALIAAIAKMETDRRSERVKAGLSRRLKEGKAIGGRRIELDNAKIKSLYSEGYSVLAIATHIGVSRGTINNRLKELGLKQ